MNAYEAELSAEDARAIVKTLADAELKLFDQVGNPPTGGSFQVIAYDASGSVLFCSYYDGEWFGVTFEGDENGYNFNGKDSGLDALALPPQKLGFFPALAGCQRKAQKTPRPGLGGLR